MNVKGDTLNILLIINKDFQTAAENVFNPRNSMYISKNDGMFNNSYNHKRDTIINMNTLVQLSRNKYTPQQLASIKAARRRGRRTTRASGSTGRKYRPCSPYSVS